MDYNMITLMFIISNIYNIYELSLFLVALVIKILVCLPIDFKLLIQ
jgi:hypothetical protein